MKSLKIRIKKALRFMGPGLITGAADVDPSAIATYSQAGARFGFGLLWVALFFLPLLAAVQELCARIGVVTGKGIVTVIRENYGREVLYLFVFLIVVANTITLGADIGAMAEAARLLIPLPRSAYIFLFTAFILGLQVFVPYPAYARILRWFSLVLLAYPLTVLILNESWLNLVRATVLPSVRLEFEFLFISTAILGAALSPYMYLWQASEEVEEEIARGCLTEPRRSPDISRRFIRRIRIDTFTGMFASAVAVWSILAVSASVFNRSGLFEIRTAAEAARALEPLVRGFSYSGMVAQSIFAVGVVGLGFLAVPVLAGSASYALAECFNWREGLNLKFSQARGFYGVIIAATLTGLLMNFVGVNPFKALVLASVFNGIAAGPLLYVILQIGKNEQIMGGRKSGPLSVFLVLAAALVAAFSAIGMFLSLS